MSAAVLDWASQIAVVLLVAAMLLTAVRVVLGPTLADRVLALDQMVAIAIGFIAVVVVRTGIDLYIDIALALGLVGFLATAAFARYIDVAGRPGRHNPGEGDDHERP
jgi:multicomponent Na+:H+ antiporter subunit F